MHAFPPLVGAALDLNEDEVIDRSKDGVYSAELFGSRAVQYIRQHAAERKGTATARPLFLYLALQNVHNPLQVPEAYPAREACASIPNPDRRVFCGMAAAADDAVANVTAAFERHLPREDLVLVLGGDNGGLPGDRAAGSNCPGLSSPTCFRGCKGMVWEGGVRNHALMCSATLLPSARRGAVYAQGMVHVVDWHATILELAGAAGRDLPSSAAGAGAVKPLDGVSVWSALVADAPSPRTEFVVNIDPVDFFNPVNKTWAYRYRGCIGEPHAVCGDWKYVDTPVNASWYPPPLTRDWPRPIGKERVAGLYNLSADPGEHADLQYQYPGVVAALVAKLEALEAVAMTPCNLPGGTCDEQDVDGIRKARSEKAWVPWSKDEL